MIYSDLKALLNTAGNRSNFEIKNQSLGVRLYIMQFPVLEKGRKGIGVGEGVENRHLNVFLLGCYISGLGSNQWN
jgi:hypothetical protein